MLEQETASVRTPSGLGAAVKGPVANSWNWTAKFTRTKPLGRGRSDNDFSDPAGDICAFGGPLRGQGDAGRENVHQPPSAGFIMGTDHVDGMC